MHPTIRKAVSRLTPRQRSVVGKSLGQILLGPAFTRITGEEKRGARLAVYIALRHPILLGVILLTNLVAAVFDGGTMGIIALAVTSLISPSSANFEMFGSLGEVARDWRNTLGPDGFFITLVVFAVLAQVARSSFQFLGFWCAARLQKILSYDMQMRIINSIMQMRYARIIEYPAGRLEYFIAGTNKASTLAIVFSKLLGAFLTILAYVAVLFWLSWAVTLAALLLIGLISLVIVQIIVRVHKYSNESRKQGKHLDKYKFEFLQSPRLLRIFGRETYAMERIRKYLTARLEFQRKSKLWHLSMTPFLDSVGIVAGGMFLLISFYAAGANYEAVLPVVLSFLVILNRMLAQVRLLNDTRGNILSLLPYMGQTQKIFEDAEKHRSRRGGIPVSSFNESILFDDVTFKHRRALVPALKDINLEIRKGDMLGVVGASGSGKSTLVDLVIGLQNPTKGRVEVDGVDLETIDPKRWRQLLAVVDQDMMLMNDTICENVIFGDTSLTRQDAADALSTANCREFVEEMPKGMDTAIGDRGIMLSGGQRQRLVLARAIARKPEVLILDEATSALDSLSEKYIQDSLRKLRGKCTMLVVAHRLSTLSQADRIIVLKEGLIVESGSHEELLERGGDYARMWRVQSRTNDRSGREEAVSVDDEH